MRELNIMQLDNKTLESNRIGREESSSIFHSNPQRFTVDDILAERLENVDNYDEKNNF